MDQNGKWKLFPAYDLTFSNSAYGFHSTTIAGESKNPGIKHLNELAKHFGVKNADQIFAEVSQSIAQFDQIAANMALSKNAVRLIKSSLQV